MQHLDKKIIRANFGRGSEEYSKHARLQKGVAEELLKRIELNGDEKILDIGSGSGFLLEALGEANLTQADLSFDMCQKVNGSAVNADMESLPFADESFDFIVSSLAIQWSVDLRNTFEEASRVLANGGKFAISTFGAGSLFELEESFADLDTEQHLVKMPSSMQIFAAAKMAGLDNVAIESQDIIYKYHDIFDLLKSSFKSVGASYNFRDSANGMKGKRYFNKLENIYKSKFEMSGHLPLTWKVLYITGGK